MNVTHVTTTARVPAPQVAARTVNPMTGPGYATGVPAPRLTPVQEDTFTNLLQVGGPRPYAPIGLVEELRQTVLEGTREPLSRWTEPTLWLSKGQLFSALRCEASYQADKAAPRTPGKHPATAVGELTHRAVQMAHTHPGQPVAAYLRAARDSLLSSDPEFAAFHDGLDMAAQSDLVVTATSRVTAFLDSWPPLHPAWEPRFEEPLQAKVGKLTLSARPDLVLGRPRASGQQSMVIVDWKSGAIREEQHTAEAMFYALVATLRHGVPPFRSTVYSLASGTYTDPDVTAERLKEAAQAVVRAVGAVVDVLTERRAATPTPGLHCGYCRLKADCPVSSVRPDQD
jgi:hypothetical protein